MPPASTLRVSRWLIYVFSVFTLVTGAPCVRPGFDHSR